MDTQPTQTIQPEIQPQKPMNKTWQIVALTVAGVLVVGGVATGSYYLWQKSSGNSNQTACTMEAKQCDDGSYVGRTGPNCEFAACPSVSASPSTVTDETADWQTYESAALGVTFKYPKEYAVPQEQENYLSLISPLNPNRIPKMPELQDGELKIEIVTEAGQENDTTLKCWNDHSSGGGEITGQTETTVDGIKTTVLSWRGLGTGQFICLDHNGKRYLINKYPAETTRQNEYDNILSTFKFIDDPTVSWQTYKNDQYGFEFKYPAEWGVKSAAANHTSFAPVNENILLLTVWAAPDVAYGFESVGASCNHGDIIIGGVSTKTTTYCGANPDMMSSEEYARSKDNKFIVTKTFKKDGIDYNFSFFINDKAGYQHESLFYQILSTFKFTK